MNEAQNSVAFRKQLECYESHLFCGNVTRTGNSSPNWNIFVGGASETAIVGTFVRTSMVWSGTRTSVLCTFSRTVVQPLFGLAHRGWNMERSSRRVRTSQTTEDNCSMFVPLYEGPWSWVCRCSLEESSGKEGGVGSGIWGYISWNFLEERRKTYE